MWTIITIYGELKTNLSDFYNLYMMYNRTVMGKILFKSIFKIENKIVKKKYFENNKIKYFTKVFSKYKIK